MNKAHEIKIVPIESVKPNSKNPNRHPPEQIERLRKIIREQGFRSPLVISNQSGLLVVGHGRLLAAQAEGFTELPVIFQDFDNEAMEYAHMTADNALQVWSELDFSQINTDIGDFGPELDIELLGIKNFLIEPLDKIESDPDATPDPPVESKSKLGDLWTLGKHRLLCGDSTNIQHVERLMDGKKADMVFTDPPYGVNYEGGHNKKKRSGIRNDELTNQALTNLFADALTCACIVCADHAAFYIWYANGKAVETFASFSKLPLKVRAVLCWYKIRSGLGAFMSQYIPNYEPCIYAFKEGCSPQWFGPSDEKTVWELQKENQNEYHPTQKPIALPERAMKNSSKNGDIVLDLFGGSGSTLIAAEKNDRCGYLIELDPKYVDVILKRWADYTGKDPIRDDGIKWSELNSPTT